MPERKQRKESTSLRVPQPKKLGLSVPPVLRLPHDDLIRPEKTTKVLQTSESDHSGSPANSEERAPASGPSSSMRLAENASQADCASPAEFASLANLDGSKTASLAKPDDLALQIASLANPARHANSASLPTQATVPSLMNSLPEAAGFTRLHHQIVDHLYCQLSPKEQIVHLQLYRLSWGRGHPNCFISLPKLARRSNLSSRSASDAISLLEIKGLIRKGAVVTGKGKEQGVEYWIAPAPAIAKIASLANSASPAKSASLAESDHSKEYKEEIIHEEHSQTQAGVGVGSRFTPEECRRYADHLYKTGQGITNPGGFALTIHRTGEADSLIEAYLNPPAQPDISKCPDCKGFRFKIIERDGKEGAVRCRHERLEKQPEPLG